MDKTEIIEAAAFNVPETLTGRKYRVRLIEGDRLGSSGYYPAETIRRDGPRIFKKGTPMYLDHQMPNEKEYRPHGSVTTYAGTLAEDAFYENDGLYADIEVFEHQMPLIKSLKDHIGISIRALGRTEKQTINGKTVPVFKELIEARSADFVVKAGAGGKIMSILESATLEEENMEEVLNKIEELKNSLPAMITSAVESAVAELPTAEVESQEGQAETKTVEVVDYAKVVELAEALAASKLGAAGRERVLKLHKAEGADSDIKALIAAEEAYIADNSGDSHEEGAEESADREAEESAGKTPELKLPSRWTKK